MESTPNASLRLREICLSFLAFVLLVSVLFHDITTGGRTIASAPHVPFTLFEGPVGYRRADRVPFSDAGGAALSNEASVPFRKRSLAAGHLPFWHPHEGCGQPYLAGYQPGFFFPLHFLMLIGPGPLGIDLTYLGRLVLAGWFMYLFLRVHRLTRLASLSGGLIFLGSGYLVTDVNSTNVSVESLIPGLLLALELLVTRRRSRDLVLAVAMVALVLAGGNPEAAFLGFVLGGFYALVRVLATARSGRLRLFGLVFIAHLLGALVAAPLILPFLEFYAHSLHYHHTTHHAVTAPLGFLALFVNPGLFENVDFDAPAAVYGTGSIGCVLACMSIAGRRHLFLKLFTGFALVFTALFYFGMPGIRELRALPLINQFSLYKYPAAHLCLHVSVLGGLGAEFLLRGASRTAGRLLAASCLVPGLVVILFTLFWAPVVSSFNFNAPFPQHPDPSGPHFGILPYLLAAALGLGLVLVRRPGSRRIVAGVLVGLALFEIHYHIPRPYPPRRDIYSPPEVLAELEEPYCTYRIYSPEPILFPNTSAIFGLNDIRYLEVLKIDRYVNLIQEAFHYPLADFSFNNIALRSGVPVHALRMLGVRFVLGSDRLVPLSSRPLPADSRMDFVVDLYGGKWRLAGEVVVPPGQAGEVVLHARDSHAFHAGPIQKHGPGGETIPVAHRTVRHDFPVATYLAVHFEPGTCFELKSLTWAGKPVSAESLRAGSTLMNSMAGYYFFDNFRVRPEGLLRSRFPFQFALPSVKSGTLSELVLCGRSRGNGHVSTALLDYKATELKRAKFSNPSGEASVRIPFRLDLESLSGRNLNGRSRFAALASGPLDGAGKARRLPPIREYAKEEQRSMRLREAPRRGLRIVTDHLNLSLETAGNVVVEGLRLVPDGIAFKRKVNGVSLFEVDRPLPRAFGVYEVEVISEEKDQLTRLLDLGFPYQSRVILDRLPDGIQPARTPPANRPVVTWIQDHPSGCCIELHADFSADGFLVLLDNFFPGWKARVDGEPVQILRGNYTFRAVPVPAGTHRIRFEYLPTHWYLSLVLACLGIVGTALTPLVRRRFRCPGSPRESGGS